MNNPLHHTLCRWAVVVIATMFLPSAISAQVQAEYFIDADPGMGNATTVAVPIGSDGTMQFNIPTANLTPGNHLVGIRAYNTTYEGGKAYTIFGPTITQAVLVKDDYEAQKIKFAEYFWGEDPGFGQGTPIPIIEGQEATLANIQIPTNGIAAGEYNLGIRACGSKGWGPTITERVIVKGEYEAQQILQAEYFWGDDPGFGQGTPILITKGQEVTLEDLQIPTQEAHGSSILSIRACGSKGWGPTIVTDVLVDAEGNYTLNAETETSLTNRNYQSLDDIISDFSDRGVGDDVTLNVTTTNTTYALDATTDSCLQLIAKIAGNLDNGSTSRNEHVINFTAEEGSGNSIAITTTDDGLPTVVSMFARVATTNVQLTINGTAYDFTAASVRHEEMCPATATQAVALTTIGGGVKAKWTAMPHSGTTITGYDTSGTGNLPVMTLDNSGTQCDSLIVSVTLTTSKGKTLTTYDYTYIVHARMSTQSFTTMTPANGSSLDPGKATLTWNAIGDAVGYRLNISQKPLGDTTAEATEQTVETNGTSHELTVESGMEYTWTVTAVGACDELTSEAMTLSGRLLPDLVVSSIILPEAAEAGNAITVKATITNQGEGATTEGTWTDRVYYTVNSTNFDDAILLGETQHSGNIAAGGSYEAVFEAVTPMEDSGQLRVFVITNVNGDAKESNADNNRMMSTTTADLKPFYMNTDDLAALRQIYANFSGAEWNGEKWDVTSTIIKKGNWSGVTFDSDGHVTAINLQGRGLAGAMSAGTAPALTMLTTLNMSRNAITGDAATFVTAQGMPLLTTLNLSYNQLDELSAVLPSTITNLNITYQHRTYGSNSDFPGIDNMEPLPLNVASDMTVTLPSIATYNHAKQTFGVHPKLGIYTRSYINVGTLTWSTTLEAYTFSPSGWKVTVADGSELVLVPTTSSGNNYANAQYSAMRSQIHFTDGDANLNGWTDVNDVQRTLNYVLNTNNSSTFGLWAANTYDDDSYDANDETINVQDIVCTVNIVLENEASPSNAPRRANGYDKNEETDIQAHFFADGRKIVMEADEEIAAFSMQLEGVSASQVKLMLNAGQWQMQTRNTSNGVCIVVFSPTGSVLPTGTTTLLRLSGDGQPTHVQATDAEAEEVAVDAVGTPTSIAAIGNDSDIRVTAADGQHIVVSAAHEYGPTTIRVFSTSGMMLGQQRLSELPAGDTTVRINAATDVVVVSISNEEVGTRNHQITTRQ